MEDRSEDDVPDVLGLRTPMGRLGPVNVGRRNGSLRVPDQYPLPVERQSDGRRVPTRRDEATDFALIGFRYVYDGNVVIVRIRHDQAPAVGGEGKGVRCAALGRFGIERRDDRLDNLSLRQIDRGNGVGIGVGNEKPASVRGDRHVVWMASHRDRLRHLPRKTVDDRHLLLVP